MTKELAIVKYIKEFGLDNAVDTFKIKVKEYDKKVLLKYDQIESDMSFEEVQDCRGLILEKGTWKVMSLAFRKFFNSAETHAAEIDWTTSKIFEKCDGTMIQMYWDWNDEKWYAGTTGMAEAEGEVNEKPNTTFASLFWETVDKYNFDVENLVKGRTYIFELMTPYNVVVTPHSYSKLALLGVRHLNSLAEIGYHLLRSISFNIGIPMAKRFDFNVFSEDFLIETFENMPFSEEGYVVCDAYFNRVKIKNPAYVAAHHLKSKTGAHHIMTIVKTNEIEEYGATFPERLEEIQELKVKYDDLVESLTEAWDSLQDYLPNDDSKEEQKKFAFKVFDVVKEKDIKPFQGMFFALKDGKADNVKDYITNFDNKRLYELFI